MRFSQLIFLVNNLPCIVQLLSQSSIGTTTTSAIILSTTRSLLITWLDISWQSTTLKMKIFGFTVIIQNKNKHAFSLYQKLAGEFNLRIIRTYGASGHRKGVIDVMSSFGAKNILRHNIIT